MEAATEKAPGTRPAVAPMRPIAGVEARLLLCCARLSLQRPARERIARLIAAGPDWKRLMAMAHDHGLTPLLHRHLAAFEATVPRWVLLELWGRHEARARLNRAIAAELLELLHWLESAGIVAIPFKGPVLAQALYGDVAMREFGDLDILVRASDLARARAALEAHGYVPRYPLSPAVEAAFLRSRAHHHLVMRHPARTLVELHWRTDAHFPVEAEGEDWWAHRPTEAFMGTRVRAFEARERVLLLCLHGTRHHWSSLGWLVDVAEAVRQDEALDWDWILARAASLGCERRLAVGLHLAAELLGAPLPPRVRRMLAAQARACALAERMVEALHGGDRDAPDAWSALRLNLALFETRRERLRHLVDTLLAPSLVEWTRWPLPRGLFFLYLPLRLSRLAGKYLGIVRRGA
jgi:hypothetical protein